MSSDVILSRGMEITAWYSRPVGNAEDITETAFKQAREILETQLGEKEVQGFLGDTASLDHVVEALVQAQTKFLSKPSKRKSRTCWQAACSFIMNYETVIDVLISSHPEYAALVWGPLKFLLKATLGYEEISERIAQAVAEIGSVLAEVNFIAKKLYPIPPIKATLANIYAQILNLCIRATTWYTQLNQGFFSKVLGAIGRAPLDFADIKLEIQVQVRRMWDQAAIASQAEQRDMHSILIDVHHLLGGPSPVHRAFSPGGSSPRIVQETLAQGSPMLLGADLAARLGEIPFDAHEVLRSGVVLRDRRRSRAQSQPSAIWQSPELRDWIATPASSLLLLQDARLRSSDARDLAMDLIQALQAAGLGVVWYLAPLARQTRDPRGRGISTADILRSLVQQTLGQVGDGPVAVGRAPPPPPTGGPAAGASGEEACLELLLALLARLPKMTLVIDAQGRPARLVETVQAFRAAAARQCPRTVVKILVVGLDAAQEGPLLLRAPPEHETRSLDLASAQGARASRSTAGGPARPPRGRGPGAARGSPRSSGRGGGGGGVEAFTTFLRQQGTPLGQ